MEGVKIVRRKTLPLQQGDSQRIADGQHAGGRCRRRQVQRTGLADVGQNQRRIAGLVERAAAAAHQRDERNGVELCMGDQIRQLDGLSRIRQGQHDIAFGDHSQIAMACLGRIDILSRRSGGGQRGGNLVGDMAALAHAAHDDAPIGFRHDVDGFDEVVIQRIGDCGQPGGLVFQNAPCDIQVRHFFAIFDVRCHSKRP